MHITADFPGGNVQVDKIDGHHVYFRPDLRDTQGDWFYWYASVRDAAGSTIHFHPTMKNILTLHAPAFSVDGGQRWQWLDRSVVQPDGSFVANVPQGVSDYRMSFSMPYVQEQLHAFETRHASSLRVGELCRSPNGQSIARWQTGPDPASARYRIFLTARHHCCEMMASYVLDGLLAAAMASDDLGEWYQRNVSITAVPFVDWDGVAAGDQGKNRAPRDHNRDYDGSPIYPQTPAIQQQVQTLADRGLNAVIDLHCPWIFGPGNEAIYMVGNEDPDVWREQQHFADLLQQSVCGALPYNPANDIPFGVSWNTAGNYTSGKSFIQWASGLKRIRLCTTFEIPYANVRDQIIDQSNAQTFGADLAAAIKSYLLQDKKGVAS